MRTRADENFPCRNLQLAGWVTTALFVGSLAAWGAQAPLASAVIASGVMVVESSRKLVQHLEGGIVSAIVVQDGNSVEIGDPLVMLDDTASRSHLARLRHRIDALFALRARLQAERDDRERIVFPWEPGSGQVDERISALIDGELALFEAGRRTREGEIGLLKKRIEVLHQQISGLGEQVVANERQAELIREEHSGLVHLLDKGIVPKTRVLALERAAARLDGERAAYITESARVEKEIGETALRIIQLRKEFHNEVVKQLNEVEKQIADYREQKIAAADILERKVVRATGSGVVVNMAVKTVGEVIAPGTSLLEIVPDGDTLLVDVMVRPQDIDRVKMGQETEVRLTAFSQKETPTYRGVVTYVSADRLVTPQDGRPYYAVKVRLQDGKPQGKAVPLVPGMPAEVFIKSESRTLFAYIAKPLADAFQRAMREE